MDFRKLSRAIQQQQPPSSPFGDSTNTTLPGLNDLPPNILEALIPGYSIISRYASAYFGLDISLFVTIGIALFALNKGGQYAYLQLERLARATIMSSVYIDEHDDLFDMMMGWLAAHQATTSRSRSMRAKTQRGSKADDAYDEVSDDALDANGLFNFTNWSARTPPRYEPYYGSQYVWFNRRIFFFKRSRQPSQGQRVQVSFGQTAEDDIIQLDCLGRSIEPIKELIKAVRVWSLDRTRHTTTIRHPTPKERARYGGAWSKTSSRPSRPMDTVILDTDQKQMIIRDMNEYLHPASPKWYATRGIPYRRGYLFHGPPGTGKTSLSFALAGIFGLEIYAISLQEPSLTEGDLMQLFNSLPRRCIVLLEDVDAAGLLRDGNSDGELKPGTHKKKKEIEGTDDAKKDDPKAKVKKGEPEPKPKKEEEYTLKDLAKELKALSGPRSGGGGGAGGRGGAGGPNNNNRGNTTNSNNPNDPNSRTGISLSGLLNAIDGVATHEGRVLIMTTNHPEKLDAALIRPGRVDRKVEFRLAMREQIRELFVRMYAASDDLKTALSTSTNGSKMTDKAAKQQSLTGEKAAPATANGHIKPTGRGAEKPHLNGHAPEPNGSKKTPNGARGATVESSESPMAIMLRGGEADELSGLSRADIERLAEEFAAHVPDDMFTPAEIQNLLMRHKKSPEAAVGRVEAWVRETGEEKERERRGLEEEGDEEEGDE